MRDYLARVKKYEKKISRNIIDEELKKRMVENYSNSSKIFSFIDELVNKILNRKGILIGEQRLFYYAFARELFKIRNKYEGKVAKREIKIILDKWLKRKLKKNILLIIKRKVEKYLSRGEFRE